jgi:gas vesicle protein
VVNSNQGVGAGSLLLAFLSGAVTGAALALLFAPATGEDTRQYLGQAARDGRERAAEAARQGREVIARQKDNLTSAFERGREAYQTTSAPSSWRCGWPSAWTVWRASWSTTSSPSSPTSPR